MNAWLLLLMVWGVLMAFWFFLGKLFDAIEDMQAAWRESREDLSANKERARS
jgi:hypothetical protein